VACVPGERLFQTDGPWFSRLAIGATDINPNDFLSRWSA
jgi:hypothetical protein